MAEPISRRRWLFESGREAGTLSLAALALAASPSCSALATGAPDGETRRQPFGISLNTSTLFGQKLGIAQAIEIAAKAGYDGLEPWVHQIEAHVKAGGTVEDL